MHSKNQSKQTEYSGDYGSASVFLTLLLLLKGTLRQVVIQVKDPGTIHVRCNESIERRICRLLARIIHEDSASRVNSAKQVTRSSEKSGSPRAEGDRVRCDALLAPGAE